MWKEVSISCRSQYRYNDAIDQETQGSLPLLPRLWQVEAALTAILLRRKYTFGTTKGRSLIPTDSYRLIPNVLQIVGTLAPEWLHTEIKAAQAARQLMTPKPDKKEVEMTQWLYDQLKAANLIACKCTWYSRGSVP